VSSASGSTLTGPTSTLSLTDSAGNTWTLTGGVVYENGKAAGYTASVVLVLYYNSLIYQEWKTSAGGGWYGWVNGGWVLEAQDPRTIPTPTPAPTQTVTLAAGQSVLVNFGGSASITITASS
jgi:hypothetical protein